MPTDNYMIVDLEAAQFWARCNQGHWSGDRWMKAVRRYLQVERDGGRPQIRWWRMEVQKDHAIGGGLVEVIALPPRRRRRRRRPAP